MSDEEIEIEIPNEVEHTRPLECAVEPPQSNMSLEFACDGETFRIGYIKNRRIQSIACFVFRPRRNQLKKQIDKPLDVPCKITATVKVYDSYDREADKFGKVIKKHSREVSVVPEAKPTT